MTDHEAEDLLELLKQYLAEYGDEPTITIQEIIQDLEEST